MFDVPLPVNREHLAADAALDPRVPRSRLDPESITLSEDADEQERGDEYLTTQRPDRFEAA
jgi:hypothetical protein